MINVSERLHWFAITVQNSKRDVIFFVSWSGLHFDLRLKYNWYFRYRAALLQVQHPKCEVITTWGNEPAHGKSLAIILKNKITAKKGKITELQTKIRLSKNSWNSLFPIEDDLLFQKAVKKVERLEKELIELQAQHESITIHT